MAFLLEVRGLRKYYPVNRGILFRTVGCVKAVDDISFTIKKRGTFALVGESGCGKTTTAKSILLLEKPNGGSIFFCGRDISTLRGTELNQFRSSVQAVFQNPFASLSPRMRVERIVGEPLSVSSNLPRKLIRERVEEVLAQVGLSYEGSARLFPHEFSGGQRQRIALARALSVRPSLIVLDEPVSALDVSIQAQIMNLLKDLQMRFDVSYLLIAHNLATVRYMSDEIGVMYLGKLVEWGPSEQVYSRQAHPYTEGLFSAVLPSHPDLVHEEIVLRGEVPSALEPPSGCRFHPRCFSAMPICAGSEPEWREVAPGHYVACHLYITDDRGGTYKGHRQGEVL